MEQELARVLDHVLHVIWLGGLDPRKPQTLPSVQRYFSDNEQAKRFADEVLLDSTPEKVGSLLDGKFGFEVSERK